MPSPQDEQRPAPQGRHPRSFWKKSLIALLTLFLVPLFLVLLVGILLYIPAVQDRARGKALGFLRERLGTRVELEQLHLRFPLGLALKGLYVEDQHADTLVWIGELKAHVDPFALLDQRIAITGLSLSDTHAHLAQSADSAFNFDFILHAFASEPSPSQDSASPWTFDTDGLALRNIHFSMDLRPPDLTLDLRSGGLDIVLHAFDPARMRFHVQDLEIWDTRLHMRSAPAPPQSDTYPLLASPLTGYDIKLEESRMRNVAFLMGTVGTNDSLWLAAARVDLDVKDMDLAHQRVHFDRIAIDGSQFGMVRSGAVSVAAPSDPPWLDQNDGFRYFTRDFDIAADQLSITRSAVAIHTGSIADGTTPFDPQHTQVSQLSADLSALRYSNDTISVHLERLSARSGPAEHVVGLSAHILGTPSAITIVSARIAWDDLAVRFTLQAAQGSLSKAYRNPTEVPITAWVNTYIGRDQWPTLLALLPERTLPFTTVPESFELDARAVGRIEALDTVNIALYGDAGSSLRLHGRLAQWMGSEKAEYDLVIDPFTMGAGVRAIAQAYVPTDAPFPHDLTLRAHANGSSENVRADLDLATDLGHLQGLVSASGMRGSAPDAVTLDLRADDIALARLLADTAWERTDLRIRAEGVHLNTAQRSGWLELAPVRFGYGQMDFRDLQLRAELNGDSISAKGHVRSEPLHLELDAQGRLAGGKDSLALDVSLHVPHADLNMLGVVEHDLVVAGNWAARAALDTAGHGTIALWMDSTLLESGTRQFRFGEFRAQAYSGADSTSAHVQSDAVDLAFAANTAFDTLLIHAMDKGRSFFTHDTLFHPTPGEQLEVRLDLKRTDLLTGLLFPKLHAIDLEKFEARYDGDKDELAASLILPYFRYDSLVVSGVDLQVEAAAADLTATLLTTRIAQGSFAVDGLSLDVNSRGGELQALMRIAQEDSLRYRIGMRMRTNGEERILQLDPEPVLDARTWTVDTANSVRFGPTSASVDHFELRSGVEAIALRTPTNALEIALDGFRISTLANIISTRDTVPLADGSIDGTVRFPQEDASGIAADLTVRDLAFMGTAMGTLHVGFTEPAPDVYHGTARLHSAENTLDATVDIAADNLRAKADLDLRDIAFLQPFAGEYLYALGGGVAGKIDYSDNAGHSTMRGRLDLRETHVGVVLTGATYTLVNESVIFTESGMRLANLTLRDSIGNVFVLDGDVRTEGSVDPMLDLRIRTDRFHLISSTFEQNPRFYGELYAGMGLQVSGPVKRPRASGDLNILSGTDLSVVLPGSTVELVSTEGIVVFTDGLYASDTAAVATDAEALRDSLAAHLPGAELDLRIRVDKDARFAIVLDPAAGDQATVSGSADLVFRYAPREQMFLSGPFTVESGEYTLDLYGLVKKRFELTKGGTIRWSGDPVKAEMDLQARFLSETAPFALLPSSAGTLTSERNRLQQPLPFAVLINIDGSISEPVVGFGLDLDRQLRNSFPKVNNRLDQLNQQGNEEELNRQVFGLLVLNSFIQDESSGGAPSSGIATSAARNSVNGLLTDQMNKLTGRYIKGVDISLGVNTYDQASGQSTYQRTSLDYRVSKRILDERLSFEVGGSVGVDEQGSQVSNVSSTRAAQYAILYDLTRDGRFRIRGFHENAYDLYDGEITNSGVAIMFTRDFEENARARTQGREAAKKRMEADEKRIGEEEKDQVPPVPPGKDR